MPSSIGAFSFVKPIRIDTTAAGANVGALTNFTVLVPINAASWPSSTERGRFFGAYNTLGGRVQFFGPDMTTNLVYEVEDYNAAVPGAYYWVTVPAIAANSVTYIYLAYGNDPNGSAQWGGPWDANYRGVWHLLSGLNDSTGDAGTLTQTNTEDVAALVVNGRHMSGEALDAIYCNDAAWQDLGTQITLEAWVNLDAAVTSQPQAYPGVICKGSGYLHYQYALVLARTEDVLTFVMNNTADDNFCLIQVSTVSSYLGAGAWHHIAASADASGSSAFVMIDGTSRGTTATFTGTAREDQTTPFEFGTDANLLNPIHAKLDEVRISVSARSSDWLKATYYSINQASAFLGDGWMSFGSERVGRILSGGVW